MNLGGLKIEVENIMSNDVRTRNDDLWLIYKVWKKRTRIFIPFEDFKKLPSAESITRVRRKIQNDEELFVPTEGVRFNRLVKMSAVKTWVKL